MKATITNLQTGKTIDLVRDVRHEHPDWVHEQLETEGKESGVQHYLDQCSVGDYYDGDGHLGADENGVALYRDEV